MSRKLDAEVFEIRKRCAVVERLRYQLREVSNAIAATNKGFQLSVPIGGVFNRMKPMQTSPEIKAAILTDLEKESTELKGRLSRALDTFSDDCFSESEEAAAIIFDDEVVGKATG